MFISFVARPINFLCKTAINELMILARHSYTMVSCSIAGKVYPNSPLCRLCFS